MEKKSDLILILGSKPDAVIPLGINHIYAANASAYFYKDRISDKVKLTVITSAGDIYDNNLNKTIKFEKTTSADYDELIIVGFDKRPGSQNEILSQFNSDNIRMYTSAQRRKIFKKLVGEFWIFSPNILLYTFFGFKNFFFLRYFIAKVKSIYMKSDLPAEFRPSTGMTALAVAIQDNPDKKDFVISGIGFNRTIDYPDGTKPIIYKRQSHIVPDMAVLHILKRKYNLYTTDFDLSNDFGLNIFT
jgi:hypothetical protein